MMRVSWSVLEFNRVGSIRGGSIKGWSLRKLTRADSR